MTHSDVLCDPIDRKLSEIMSSCALELKMTCNIAEKCVAATK